MAWYDNVVKFSWPNVLVMVGMAVVAPVVLPAVGYHPEQLRALQDAINATDAEVIVSATPCDLAALLDLNKPVVRARYEFAEAGTPGLGTLIEKYLSERKLV